MPQRAEPSAAASAETEPKSLDQLARELLVRDGADDPGREEARKAIQSLAEDLYHITLTHGLGRADPVARFWHAWDALLNEAGAGQPPAETTADGRRERDADAAPAGVGDSEPDDLGWSEGHPRPDDESAGSGLDDTSIDGGIGGGAGSRDGSAAGMIGLMGAAPAADPAAPAAAARPVTIGTAGHRSPDRPLQPLLAIWARTFSGHEGWRTALGYVPVDDAEIPPSILWELIHLGLLRLREDEVAHLRDQLRREVGDWGVTEALVPKCTQLDSPGIPLHPAKMPDTSIPPRLHQEVEGVDKVMRDKYPWLVIATSDLLFLGDFDRNLGVNMIGVRSGPGLQPVDDSTWRKYKSMLLSRIKDLARANDPATEVRLLIGVDEMLAGLVPDPLPERFSWWDNRREALADRLREAVKARGGEVRHVGGSHREADKVTSSNVSVAAPPSAKPGDVLWILRWPYRSPKGQDRGRMIYAGSEPAGQGSGSR
jgi:hypothetical protein